MIAVLMHINNSQRSVLTLPDHIWFYAFVDAVYPALTMRRSWRASVLRGGPELDRDDHIAQQFRTT